MPLITALPVFFILSLSLFMYWPCLGHQFMIDDFFYLYESQNPRTFLGLGDFFSKTVNQHYEPLNNLFNVTLFRVFPSAAQLYFFNIVFLAIAAIALFYFIVCISENRTLAFTASTLFILHPTTADLVNHISLNVVFVTGFFLLVSFVFLNQSSEKEARGNPGLLLSYLFYILALLMQENVAIAFPFYVFTFLRIFKQCPLKDSLKKSFGFFILAFLHLTLWAFNHIGYDMARIFAKQTSILAIVVSFAKLLWWYLSNLFVPRDIIFMFNVPLEQDGGRAAAILALTVLASTALVIFYKKACKSPLTRFAFLWFFLGLIFIAPASLTRPRLGLTLQPYWLFFPSMGFFILAAGGLLELKRRVSPFLYACLFFILCFSLAISSLQINLYASTELSYAHYWLKNNPRHHIPKMILGTIYTYSELRIPDELKPHMEELLGWYVAARANQRALDLADKLILSSEGQEQKSRYLSLKEALLLKIKKDTEEGQFKSFQKP